MQNTNQQALLVGVGKRTDDQNPHMDITAKDAERLGLELGNICQVPASNIVCLTDKEASLKNINDKLDALIDSTEKSKADMVWFYFSGHGYRESQNNALLYYLICRDTDDDLGKTALLGSDLLNKLKQIRTDKMVILLDCCHAGGIGNAQVTRTHFPLDTENIQMNNRVIITASHSSEESFVSSPVSLFTYALIQGLSGDYLKETDKNITIFDLAMFIREQVNGLSGFKQKPRLYAFENSGTRNFILAHHPNGKPKMSVFREKFELRDSKGNPINRDIGVVKDNAYRAEYKWLELLTVDHIETANIKRIEKADVGSVGELKLSITERDAKKLHEQTGQLISLSQRNKPVPYVYHRPYVGRENDVERLHSFFESSKKRFLFLFGTGGMGKSHLLQEVNEHLTIKPAYFRLSQSTNMITLALEMGYGNFDALTDAEQRNLFLKNATEETVPLVFDDFYELRDEFVYKTILELSNLPKGKFLVISRVLPIDYEGINIDERQLELNELSEDDFSVHLQNYYTAGEYDFDLTPNLINACWEHCKGYPLGGEFLLKLRDIAGEDFDNDIGTMPKIDPKHNKRHHDFMKRLLGSILEKGSPQERELARQMAVFTEPMLRIVFIGLPAFERDAFFSLTERKKLFYTLKGDFFGVHALVRTVLEIENGVSYEAHAYAGSCYEQIAQVDDKLDIENLTKALYHYEKSQSGDEAAKYTDFLSRWKPKFNFVSVKKLITPDLKKTIDQLSFRLRLQPDDVSAMNELGRALRRDNQFSKAIEVLEKAVSLGSIQSMNELGMTYREAKNLPKAIEVLEKAVSLGSIQSMNELGMTYREAKNLPKAIEVLEKAVSLQPDNVILLNELGMTYREAKNLPKAIEVLEKAVSLGSIQSMNELGMTYREAKNLPKAIEVLEKAVAVGNIQSMNELGMTYREAKNLPKAIEVLEKAVAVGNIQSMNELGMTYREAKNLPKAIEVLEKAVAVGNIQSMNELGMTYREAKNLPKAIEVLEKAVAAGHIPSMNELGMTYREAKNLPKAIEVLEKAVAVGNIQSMNELGMTYREAKNLPKAIEVLEKAVAVGNIQSMNELGITYREAKNLPKAIEVLEKAVAAGHIPSMNELGMTYREAKKLPKAIEVLEKAVSLQPDNVILLNELGMTYREAKNLPKAIEVLEKAVAAGHIPSMNELGMTYREAKNLPKAIEVLEKAVAAGHIPSMNELGMTYREAKNLPKAIEVLEKAVAVGNIQSMNELGMTYREAKNLPKAIEVLEKAVAVGNIQSMNELGMTYREAKNLPKAIEVLEKAVAVGNIQSMNELGMTYREAKNLPKAIEVLEKAVSLGSIQSMNELGKTYREAKNLSKAIEILNNGLNKHPQNTYLKYTLFQIYLLFEPNPRETERLFEELPSKIQIQYKEIITHFDDLIKLKYKSFKLYNTYIGLLFQNESWDWAVVYLEKLIKIHSTIEFKGKYGKALLKTGRFLEALPILQSAMEATNKPGKEIYFQYISTDYIVAVNSVVDYLNALKKKGSNKEARKKFDVLQKYLTDLSDFESRKAYWRGE